MEKRPAIAIIFILLFGLRSFSQKTAIYTESEADFKKGVELFQKEKYGAAQNIFQNVIKSHKDPNTIARIDAEYYNAICAIELFHKNGELLLKTFVYNHPESPRIKTAYFNLGKYNYRKNDYKDALNWFSQVDIYDLDKKARNEFLFKRGYCNFQLDSITKAKTDFYEVKDVDNKFAAPATYYFSHIAYRENNYETALNGFQKLLTNDDFGPVVPYYIVQIYFIQEKFNDVIYFGTPMLDSANTKRAPEIARIIGESYYKTERYKEAIPYFKRYEKRVSNLSKEDSYELAYAYYRTNEIDNAITYFQGATTSNEEENLTSQSAFYHLADCYLKKGNKKFARSAFYAASKSDFDMNIKEDALFSYAKLSYDLAYDPYNETIEAFKNYIEKFPNSTRKDEAYGFLVNTYLTTKNYPEAIRSIEGIPVVNDELKQAYQKISYYRGVEFYNNNSIDSSLKYFDKALVYQTDKNINALAHFWKGEAFFKKKMYELAIHNYDEFMIVPGAFNKAEYNACNYGIGYCYFQMQDYPSANIAFRKFTDFKNNNSPEKMNDAYNRVGDTYFMMKQYDDAVVNYEKALKIGKLDKDYPLYQKALASGVLKKYDIKVSDLQNILTNYPNSNYAASAKFELAKTYSLIDKQDDALTYYKKVVEQHPNSTHITKSLLQIGQIHYNKKEDDKALPYFDKVVISDKSSTEAYQALNFIRKIYADKGDIDALDDHLKSLSYSESTNMLDSLSYEVGKKYYTDKNCELAVSAFDKYLQKYENGRYALNATYFKADCEYKQGNMEAALKGFIYVADKPKGINTERSAATVAYLYYKQKQYKEAIPYFEKLENISEYPENILAARAGLMRSNYNTGNFVGAESAAQRLLAIDKLSAALSDEAYLTSGKCKLATENYDAALEQFKIVVAGSKNDMGIEAKYNVAYIQFLKSEFKESEKIIFELIQQKPSSPYWMSKSLILLSDCYVAENDNFQAKQTLEGVIENTEDITLRQEAEKKLSILIVKEKEQVPKLSDDELKIEFKQNTLDYQNLYNEPLPIEGKKQE